MSCKYDICPIDLYNFNYSSMTVPYLHHMSHPFAGVVEISAGHRSPDLRVPVLAGWFELLAPGNRSFPG